MINIKKLVQKHNRIHLKTKTTKKTKNFATAEQKINFPLVINAQLKISYIKQ